jgi:hypothetical protein
MSTIKASCSKCGKAFGVLEHQLGTEVQCPHCKVRMRIPKLSGSSAASSGAASALDAAAAQLGPPSKPKPQGDGLDDLLAATQEKPAAAPPVAPSKPKPRGGGLDDLLAATQEKPAAAAPPKPAARPEPVESRPAHGHTTAHTHLGSPELGHPMPASTGLMRNPGVLFTLVGGLVLIIVVIAYFILTNNAEVPDLDHGVMGDGQSQSERSAPKVMTPAAKSAAAAILKMGADARGPAPLSESAEPLLLTPNKEDDFFSRRNQLVRFCTVQNTTNELVQRAAATITVWSEDGKKAVTKKTFTFRDMQPGQKMPIIVEFPYTDEKLKFQVAWRHWSPDKPVYKFAASVLDTRAAGATGGTATVEVKNESDLAAPVVDVVVILMDTNSHQRTGYVTATIRDMKPHETRNVPILWEGFESEVITGGEAYAQIGGAETD